MGTISEAYPHLVIDNFTSKLGQRVGNILKFLFPCPKACVTSPPCSGHATSYKLPWCSNSVQC